LQKGGRMLKMVIVVNSSIKMGCGKMAAQVAHAAVECAFTSYRKNEWMEEGQKKVVLKAPEKEIMKIEREAEEMGINVVMIKDAGLTQLEPGTLTTMALGPDKEEKLDELTGHLPLR